MKFNKKLIIMLASVIGVVVVLIIVIMLFTAGGGTKKLNYDEIEEKILTAGQNYYADNEDKLPETGTISLDADTLVSEGYLNDISKYTDENVTCDGTLYVTKNPSGYSYRVKLDCGKEYSTNTLKNKIMNDVVTTGSGLYEVQQVNPNNNSTTETVYIYRGDNVNNYVLVGDYYWRIVKAYENGEIAVLGDSALLRDLWDDRYNVDTNKYRGINEYEVSRLYDTISREVVGADDGYLRIKSLITTHTACIGKRNLDDTSRDGSSECSETLENQYFSLLPAYDYLNASLDTNCNKTRDASCYNYNYLSSDFNQWWTITGVADNTQDVYFVNGTIGTTYASQTMPVRMYAHLDANTTYVSGSGTHEDPYIVK